MSANPTSEQSMREAFERWAVTEYARLGLGDAVLARDEHGSYTVLQVRDAWNGHLFASRQYAPLVGALRERNAAHEAYYTDKSGAAYTRLVRAEDALEAQLATLQEIL